MRRKPYPKHQHMSENQGNLNSRADIDNMCDSKFSTRHRPPKQTHSRFHHFPIEKSSLYYQTSKQSFRYPDIFKSSRTEKNQLYNGSYSVTENNYVHHSKNYPYIFSNDNSMFGDVGSRKGDFYKKYPEQRQNNIFNYYTYSKYKPIKSKRPDNIQATTSMRSNRRCYNSFGNSNKENSKIKNERNYSKELSTIKKMMAKTLKEVRRMKLRKYNLSRSEKNDSKISYSRTFKMTERPRNEKEDIEENLLKWNLQKLEMQEKIIKEQINKSKRSLYNMKAKHKREQFRDQNSRTEINNLGQFKDNYDLKKRTGLFSSIAPFTDLIEICSENEAEYIELDNANNNNIKRNNKQHFRKEKNYRRPAVLKNFGLNHGPSRTKKHRTIKISNTEINRKPSNDSPSIQSKEDSFSVKKFTLLERNEIMSKSDFKPTKPINRKVSSYYKFKHNPIKYSSINEYTNGGFSEFDNSNNKFPRGGRKDCNKRFNNDLIRISICEESQESIQSEGNSNLSSSYEQIKEILDSIKKSDCKRKKDRDTNSPELNFSDNLLSDNFNEPADLSKESLEEGEDEQPVYLSFSMSKMSKHMISGCTSKKQTKNQFFQIQKKMENKAKKDSSICNNNDTRNMYKKREHKKIKEDCLKFLSGIRKRHARMSPVFAKNGNQNCIVPILNMNFCKNQFEEKISRSNVTKQGKDQKMPKFLKLVLQEKKRGKMLDEQNWKPRKLARILVQSQLKESTNGEHLTSILDSSEYDNNVQVKEFDTFRAHRFLRENDY